MTWNAVTARRPARRRLAGALACTLPAVGAHAQTQQPEAPTFEVYGFAQTDYIQDFKRVDPAWEDTLRPTRIPTHEGIFGDGGQASLSVKQSRLGARMRTNADGEQFYAQFEFDMFGVGVDEGQTTIRLRHAYGEWGCWLAGQTNSLFMDIDLFPNTIDYWGPSGMVFFRNPQIRWQPIRGPFYFAAAIERPLSDIDAGQIRTIDPELGDNVRADELLPDLTLQAKWTGDWGHLQVSGIGRLLGFETFGNEDNEPADRVIGWGIDVGSNIKFGERNKLILGVVFGQGIASYMNDGGTDVAPDGEVGDVDPKALPLLGVIAYYDHYWSDRWSSSVGYSRTQVDNADLQADNAFKFGQYASANLLFNPVSDMLVGAEGLWGQRQDKDGSTGNDYRVQITFKYSFSSNVLLGKK